MADDVSVGEKGRKIDEQTRNGVSYPLLRSLKNKLAQHQPPVVSYCSTCKGRLDYLKRTLPANMAAEHGNPNVEFVVLDYDCPDGTFDWLLEEFAADVASGRLRRARYRPAHTFEHAHAKNMAHRIASGTILCNVDADNYIAPNSSQWLRALFAANPDSVVINMPVDLISELDQKIVWRLLRKRLPTHGLAGRIAVTRGNFERLRGYDEQSFSGRGGEDLDFGLRARELGLKARKLPHRLWGDVIQHDDDARTQYASHANKNRLRGDLRTSRLTQFVSGIRTVLGHRDPAVNPTGHIGCGTVEVGFIPEKNRNRSC